MIKLALWGLLALSLLGGAGYLYHQYQTGQEAKVARAALCEANKAGMKAEGLSECTAENLAAYVTRQNERTEQALQANAQNALAIELQREQLDANTRAVQRHAARLASTEKRMAELAGGLEQASAQSPAVRKYLGEPVPPEVDALLERAAREGVQ